MPQTTLRSRQMTTKRRGRTQRVTAKPDNPADPNDLPTQVFEEFLKALAADVPPATVERLRNALITDGKVSEPALRIAIFGSDGAPP